VPFTYGSLVYLLKNRTYLGEAGHSGKWFKGEHEPIIDPRTFQAVQNLMKDNSAGRAGKRYRSGAVLTGLIYDDRGNRMSPSFSVKNGVRYPFYVSSALLNGRKADAGSVSRIAASVIEAAVLQALKIRQGQPNEAAANRDAMNVLIERVIIRADGFTLNYVDRRPELNFARKWKDDDDVYGPPHHSSPKQDDPLALSLVHSIIQAQHWIEILAAAKFDSIEELAKSEQIHPKVLRNRIRLAFLPPDVISAALNGSAQFGLEKFSGNIPLWWRRFS
jgi:hypothetical protein